MSVLVKDEIGYAQNTRTVFYTQANITHGKDGKSISKPADPSVILSPSQWRWWGDDNLQPVAMRDDIENCGVLSAGIESKTRMAIGKGIEPFLLMNIDADGKETLEHVLDAEISDWLDLNKTYKYSQSNIYNMIGYGWGVSQFVLNKDRNYINRIKATDVFTARLEKRDLSNGFINNIYLCSDWSVAPAAFDNLRIKKVQCLYEDYEQEHLQQLNTGYEFAMLHRFLKNGNLYYPKAMWQAAQAWVKVTRSIPDFKNFALQNQMSIKYLILIADTYWKRVHKKWDNYTPQNRERIINDKYDEINKWLTGNINAGKTILAGKYKDPYSDAMIPDIEITVLDDKMKEGKMLPDSAAADKQILFSMFFNPAIWGGNLLGDGASGGAGSGSDIREAFLVQLMLMQSERMMNQEVFNLVKNVNGWAKRLQVATDAFAVSSPAQGQGNTAIMRTKKITPRLVWRYPSGILTTLDTGGSTKATAA